LGTGVSVTILNVTPGFTLSLASQHEFKLPLKELRRFCYKMISCYKLAKIVKFFYIARKVKLWWVMPGFSEFLHAEKGCGTIHLNALDSEYKY